MKGKALLLAVIAASVLVGTQSQAAEVEIVASESTWSPLFKKKVEEFQRENPNVTVKADIALTHDEYPNVMRTRATTGNIPDLFHAEIEIETYLKQDMVLALDDLLRKNKIDVDKFPRGLLKESTKDGKIYGIPFYATPSVMIYRSDLLGQAGLSVPKTWGDLVNACQTLRNKLGIQYPMTLRFSARTGVDDYVFAAGGEFMNKDRTRFTLDSPEVAEGVQFMWDLINKHKCVNPNIAKMEYWGPHDLFVKGEAAIMHSGVWEIGRLDQTFPALRGKWNATTLPCGKVCANNNGTQFWLINKKTENPDLVFKILVKLLTPEAGYDVLKDTQLPPANDAAYDQARVRSDFPLFVSLRGAVMNGKALPFISEFQRLYQEVFAGALQRILQDPNADIPAELKKINDEMNRQLRR
jgi:multiple sugar transport system substrate-binding protein